MLWPRKTCAACLWLFVFLIGHCGLAFAVDRDVRLDQLSHTSWTHKDGVPPDVRAFAQTDDGALWLGTSAGLYRFDGLRFRHFAPSTGPSLPTGPIASMMLDSDGSLWIGYAPSGVSHLKAGVVTNYTEADGLPHGNTRAIVRGRQGILWAATTAGLARFDGARWTNLDSNWQLPSGPCVTAYLDRKGGLWVSIPDSLWFLENGGHKFKLAADHQRLITDIRESADGTLWVAEEGRSVHPLQAPWLRGRNSFPEIKVGSGSILFDDHGNLWIATAGDGLRRIANPEKLGSQKITEFDTSAQIFTQKDGLSHDYARKVFEDRDRNVWVSTSVGIDRFRQTPIVPVNVVTGASGSTLAEGKNGKMWIAAKNRHLGELDGDKFTSLKYGGCDSTTGSGREVWVGCDEGIAHIVGSKLEFSPPPFPAATQKVPDAIAQDTNGKLWVAFRDGGVYTFASRKWTQFEERVGILEEVGAAYADDHGRVWFGRRDGVVELEDDGIRTATYEAKAVGVGSISAITGSDNTLWIGGPSGLSFWDGKNFHKVLPSGRSAFKNVSGILETQKDGIWLSAGTELIHIQQGEVESFRRNSNHLVAFSSLGGLDGLTSGFATTPNGQRLIQTGDGRLWFATDENVYWFDPKRGAENFRAEPAVISVTSNGQELPYLPLQRYPPHTTNLKIEYTAWNVSVPERVRLRFRLHGVDKDWQDGGDTRIANYSNLGPGSYSFELMASNDGNVWTPLAETMQFSIAPAYYQAIWFRALELIAVLLAAWLLLRLRIRQVAEKIENRMTERLLERDRIARELHDTLLQGFQGLLLRFQLAANAIPPGERARSMMEDTLNRADVVLAEGRERVRDLRSQHGDGAALAEAITKVGDDLSFAHPATFQLQVTGVPCPLHPVVRDEIEAIAKEALANAFTHSKADAVRCHLSFTSTYFLLTCSDNGIGTPPEYLGRGGREGHWGLVGMWERAEKIGAKMRLTPGADSKGTVLEVRLGARIAFAKNGVGARRRLFGRGAI